MTKLSPRPALSLLLYDLGAATRAFPPATILPEQFYASPAHRHASCGEIALMRAVLEDAVDCFQKQSLKNGRRPQRLAREAEDWLFRDEHRWPFSFVNICEVLGIDPEYVRRGLKRWREERSLAPSEKPPVAISSGLVSIAA